MIVKLKSYYLKKDVNAETLIDYDFEKYGDNYCKDIQGSECYIKYYNSTRRFVFFDCPWKESRYKKVQKHIKDLIEADLVELKTNYEWLAIIGSWQNYSQKKLDRISAKLDKLNKGE